MRYRKRKSQDDSSESQTQEFVNQSTELSNSEFEVVFKSQYFNFPERFERIESGKIMLKMVV
jgi:hypothetical protein